MAETSPTHGIYSAEPPVSDMLADPLVRLVMKRDGVSHEEILGVMRRASRARAAQSALRADIA